MNKTKSNMKSNTKDQHKEKRKIQLKMAKPKNVVIQWVLPPTNWLNLITNLNPKLTNLRTKLKLSTD
jgi:hypothetical protein